VCLGECDDKDLPSFPGIKSVGFLLMRLDTLILYHATGIPGKDEEKQVYFREFLKTGVENNTRNLKEMIP
jgi:hypothetical protein